jgi:DNA polymerase III delta subunit
MNPERAEVALRAARKLGKPRLLAALRAFQEADSRLKGGREDARTVLEFLIIDLTARAAATATSR